MDKPKTHSQLNVRLPSELVDWLREYCYQERKSINAEMQALLITYRKIKEVK